MFEQRGHWISALGLLEDMRRLELRPDSVSYHSAIAACTARWDHALDLLHRMSKEGLRPGLVAYGGLLQACLRCSQMRQASKAAILARRSGLPVGLFGEEFGKGQTGSALMGSLQFLCF